MVDAAGWFAREHVESVVVPVESRHPVAEISALRRGKQSPGGGGASPAASTHRAANGAPLAGGRFVALP
jgi:hypothetical protein